MGARVTFDERDTQFSGHFDHASWSKRISFERRKSGIRDGVQRVEQGRVETVQLTRSEEQKRGEPYGRVEWCLG